MKIKTDTKKQRFIVFFTATLLSSPGIFVSIASFIDGLKKCFFRSYGCNGRDLDFFILINFVFLTPWLLYFAISYLWIRNKAVPFNLKVLGAVLGSLAILMSGGVGLLLALPSVILMYHILMTNNKPGTGQPRPSTDPSNWIPKE